ncbi:MAG TPA: putative peptidoglycan glycosyltransferase FtsW [Candidatus Kapabacteria bacterium]|nr:putative peptidoglycan glycosyltransferase FtsW [Candidatus Kapabacteria bacterium]HPO62654.1 putative peptidoglycan glycosyltransferase FtsW [Candidatus Kapabacteria bacterium]
MEKGHIDWYILLSVVGLMLFSIAFVYSASASIAEVRYAHSDVLFINHTIRVLIGLIILFVFAKFDYHKLEKASFPIILSSILLLILVYFISPPVNNAYRWINIGPLSFQPSELAKFALVLHFACIISQREEVIKDFKFGFLPLMIWTIVIVGLIALQPNFSTAGVIFLVATSVMFIGNVNLIHLFSFSVASLTGIVIYGLSAPYRMQRILSFLGDTNISENINYQVNQAIIAFGNGGLWGVGPGKSRQSHLFLPESYGDFIFSIIGEEYGFIGTLIIIAVFVLIFWRGFKIIRKAPDLLGYLLSAGIILTFAFYMVVSIAVNCGLLPATGLPLPFISYGGTAVFFYSAAMGILLNISAYANVFPKKNSFPIVEKKDVAFSKPELI